MTKAQRIELFVERYSPLLLASACAVAWRVFGDTASSFVVGKNEAVYQTIVFFATIIVALLATFKAIIITAEHSEGVTLLKTNRDMFFRFVDYMFWCISANILLVGFAFFYLLRDLAMSARWDVVAFIWIGSFSIFSLIRILILFRIIIRAGPRGD